MKIYSHSTPNTRTRVSAEYPIINYVTDSKSGLEAARAIARGVKAAAPDAETILLPVADGGDGTLHALVDATGGEIFTSTVTGPINQQVEAQCQAMSLGHTLVITEDGREVLSRLTPEYHVCR